MTARCPRTSPTCWSSGTSSSSGGPIGGYFVWDGRGRAGAARRRRIGRRAAHGDDPPPGRVGSDSPMRLLYSGQRTAGGRHLPGGDRGSSAPTAGTGSRHSSHSRESSPQGGRATGRRSTVSSSPRIGWPLPKTPAYICGPTGFVEAVASALVESGVAARARQKQRFGPTKEVEMQDMKLDAETRPPVSSSRSSPSRSRPRSARARTAARSAPSGHERRRAGPRDRRPLPACEGVLIRLAHGDGQLLAGDDRRALARVQL